MTEQQKRLVDILGWFHDFCKKNDLRYYIIAGTLLGAVRHGGFIPWDDDVDVSMPRKDYEKLRELSQNQEKNKYMFEFPGKTNPEYPFLWAKLFDTTTTIIEKKRDQVKRGIYIDIFPLDGIGDTKEEAIKNIQPIKKRVVLDATVSCAFLKRRAWYKNMAIVAGRVISPLFVNRKKLRWGLDELCQKYDFDRSEIVGDLMGGFHERGLVPRDCFGEPKEMKFESLTVYGLEKPDVYLRAVYGDFMQLPPPEKRISFHDLEYCDLNHGYMD